MVGFMSRLPARHCQRYCSLRPNCSASSRRSAGVSDVDMIHHSDSLGSLQAIRFCAATSDPIEPAPMETNDERRKRKLRQLAALHGLDALADAAGLKGSESLDQILKGVKLPPKADGTRSERSLGDESARKIELALGLERGWFDEDWPFPLVDQARWARCTSEQRGYVQGALTRALDEVTEGKPLPKNRNAMLQKVSTPGQTDARSPASPSRLTVDEASFVGRVSEGVKNVHSDKHRRVEIKEHRGGTPRPPRKG